MKSHFLSSVAALALLAVVVQPGRAQGRTGDVYVMTNQSGGNSVLVFHRDAAGALTAAGSGPGTSAVSSYKVDEDGKLTVISPAVSDTQTAACWLVVARNGRFAYTANAGSGTISSYVVAEDGSLSLLQIAAGSTGSGSTPTDMALSGNSRFLYVRDGGNGSVSGFRIEGDGSLTPVATATGIPDGAQGIAAR